MPTVVARLEKSTKDPTRGIVYYRIYKGHNRRMEFSSRIHIPLASWDEEAKTVRGTDPVSRQHRAQIAADLQLLRQIIAEDEDNTHTMGDIITLFKARRQRNP